MSQILAQVSIHSYFSIMRINLGDFFFLKNISGGKKNPAKKVWDAG
jgi:hypothetical protein